MQRRHHAIPLQQAAQESPTFARLADLVRESSARLQAIRGLLPAPTQAHTVEEMNQAIEAQASGKPLLARKTRKP